VPDQLTLPSPAFAKTKETTEEGSMIEALLTVDCSRKFSAQNVHRVCMTYSSEWADRSCACGIGQLSGTSGSMDIILKQEHLFSSGDNG
jgi:hypothetical protein